jgi:hypothetical protein
MKSVFTGIQENRSTGGSEGDFQLFPPRLPLALLPRIRNYSIAGTVLHSTPILALYRYSNCWGIELNSIFRVGIVFKSTVVLAVARLILKGI